MLIDEPAAVIDQSLSLSLTSGPLAPFRKRAFAILRATLYRMSKYTAKISFCRRSCYCFSRDGRSPRAARQQQRSGKNIGTRF